VFDLYGNQRLIAWKQFRDQLEVKDNPFDDLAEFWSRAPFVNHYLDPNSPGSWPDPWHLILDDRLDDLAITLGMLYTLKLTTRFIDSRCEIHMTMFHRDPKYLLIVNQEHVLNLYPKQSLKIGELSKFRTNMIWSKTDRL
jgi:hypothetical protein